MRYEVRELGVGGILDQTIALLKDHFWLFLATMCLLYVPVNLFVEGLDVLRARSDTDSPDKSPLSGVTGLLSMAVVNPLTNAAVIQAVASAYLQQPMTAGDALRRASRIFIPVLGTMFVTGLFIGLGFLMLIVSGLIFSLWWLLSIQVVVLEGLTAYPAMKRSRQLMKGNTRTAILLGTLMIVVEMSVAVAAQFIPFDPLRVLVSVALESIMFVFTAAGWVVFYFSCRSKHEQFDLAMLADAVAIETPGAAADVGRSD